MINVQPHAFRHAYVWVTFLQSVNRHALQHELSTNTFGLSSFSECNNRISFAAPTPLINISKQHHFQNRLFEKPTILFLTFLPRSIL